MKQSYEEVIATIGDKLVFLTEAERLDDDFVDPTGLFIINAMGEGVYFRTRNRIKAQEWADMLYGKGKYTVRPAIRASVR